MGSQDIIKAIVTALIGGLAAGALTSLAMIITLRFRFAWIAATINNHAQVLSSLECVKTPVADLHGMPEK